MGLSRLKPGFAGWLARLLHEGQSCSHPGEAAVNGYKKPQQIRRHEHQIGGHQNKQRTAKIPARNNALPVCVKITSG